MTQTARPTLGFELKSTDWSLVALQLKSTDLTRLGNEFKQRFGDMPDFFDQDGVVIDLSLLGRSATGADPHGLETSQDFAALNKMLRDHRLRPLAVRGGTERQIAAARAAGLLHAPDALPPRPRKPVVSPRPGHTPTPQAFANALVIDKPLRCGQQIYAGGQDLVMMAPVNSGAEVIADGHIHVYAPLRGKAIAGASGNGDARIFALSMSSELLSIAGVYCTGDAPLSAAVFGKAAQISLQHGPEGDERLVANVIPGCTAPALPVSLTLPVFKSSSERERLTA